MRIADCAVLDLYTDYLISSCGLATATSMSAVLDNQISHDRVTRLLRSNYITSRRLWSEVKPMCREIEQDDAVLILSLIHISEPTRLLSISYAVFCL